MAYFGTDVIRVMLGVAGKGRRVPTGTGAAGRINAVGRVSNNKGSDFKSDTDMLFQTS